MDREVFNFLILISFLLTTGISCQKKIADEVVGIFESGDVVISNNGTKSVLLFNSEGKFKRVLFTFAPTSGQTPFGIVYNVNMETLMILTDGTADKVISIKKSDGDVNESYILDSNLNSGTANTVKAMTQLTTGDILIGETSAVERFSYTGARVTSDSASGAWPKTGGTVLASVITQMAPLTSGGSVACSNSTDAVRTYDNTYTQVGNAVSGIAATTDVTGCTSDSSGAVYAAFNGTTDTVRKYTSNSLGTTAWSYSNTSLLGNPVSLAVSKNGTVLAIDATNNWVVEINTEGTLGAAFGGNTADINSMLSTPNYIYVIP